MRWVRQTGTVHALLYLGEQFKGNDTEVFAFYAMHRHRPWIPRRARESFPVSC